VTDAIEKTDEEWRAELNSDAYAVLRRAGTEPPFTGEYTHEKATGTYRCGACGAPLFRSEAKFDSGTGWPSFDTPLTSESLELIEDRSHGMNRIEVRCPRCHSHLGHLFTDGPTASGERYCMNSVALDLEPD